jgi:hypothetical protein
LDDAPPGLEKTVIVDLAPDLSNQEVNILELAG